MKTLIRKAVVRGIGTRKRCRKSERIYVEGRGDDDCKALEVLKLNLKKALDGFREYTLRETVTLSDIWKEESISCDGKPYTIYMEEIDFGQKLPNQIDMPLVEALKEGAVA
jgi:hypothetical protein